jgi:protein-L-isoaspartate(D-aspartate) O-methyltransferase
VKVGGRIAAIIGQAPVMEASIITRTGENTYSTIKVFETNVRYLAGAPVPSHFQF